MNTSDTVLRLLDELEGKLQPQKQIDIRNRHIATAMWQEVDRPPVLIVPKWAGGSQQLYRNSEAVENPVKMLANELWRGFSAPMEWLKVRDDRPLQIRPDFGIGLVASILGAKVEVVGDNPPWVHPLTEDKSKIETCIENALEELDIEKSHLTGWLPRVSETMDYYTKIFADYPNVKNSIAITLPDLQGPFDTAAMLWGSDILLALITSPQLVDRLLAAVGQVMVHLHGWLKSWTGEELLPEGFIHQHGSIVRGNLLLRCDSNLMMSPQMYKEQIFKHDTGVLNAVSSGSYHSCGDWTQNMPTVMASEAVGTMDLGADQSTIYDIDKVYANAKRYRKHLNLVAVTPAELDDGTVIGRFPTGATLQCYTDNADDAARVMADYAQAAAERKTS